MKEVIIMAVLLTIAPTTYAACYLSAGVGQVSYNVDKLSILEKIHEGKLSFGTTSIIGGNTSAFGESVDIPEWVIDSEINLRGGSYSLDMKSDMKKFGLGCELNKYLSLEVARIDGVEMHAKGVLDMVLSASDNYGSSFSKTVAEVNYLATLNFTDTSLAIQTKLPITSGLSLIATAGAGLGKAEYVVEVRDIESPVFIIGEEKILHPVASIGVQYDFDDTYGMRTTCETFEFDKSVLCTIAATITF